MFTIFTLALSGGMLAVLATGRFGQVAWKFVRLVAFLVFAPACTATLWHWRDANAGLGGIGGSVILICGSLVAAASLVLAMIAPMAPRWRGATRLICAIGGLAGIAGACVAVGGVAIGGSTVGDPVVGTSVVGEVAASGAASTRDIGTLARTMLVLSEILASMLLGSMTVAWLLGHAYLTATRMTIEPLRHFSRIVSWSAVARFVFALVSTGLAWYLARAGSSGAWGHLADSWLIVSLRAGVGLVGVNVFAYMVADCVRLRSTQSATGILYFGSIFAYIGELAALQLVAECGWPL